MAVQAAAKRAAARPRVVKRKPVLSKFVAKAILARKRASTRTASAAARRAVRPSAAAAGLKCVVINLKARPDRWLALQKTAQKNAPWLKLERLDAVNGREHPPAEKDVCKSYRTLRLAKLFHWYRDREVTMSGVRSKKPDKKPDVRSVAQFMCGCKAREVWDYSRANLAQFSKDGLVLDSLSVGSDVVARWVPPGYTALLEGGADLWSKTRKDDKLAFLGKLKSRPDGVLNSLHQTPFWKGRVHEEGNVWNIQNLGRFVSEYPMQLILHKNQMCCPSDNVLETFRLAQLLPNKACVISATVHPLDADGWGGIVHFFGNMSEAEAVVSGLRKDVRACQRRSYALYKARFDSSKILAESGFLDMWNGGERGCCASHLKAWRKCASSGEPLLVLEDDAVILPAFTATLNTALREAPKDIGALWLTRMDRGRRTRLGEVLMQPSFLWTTVGYVIWPKAARALIKLLPMDLPVDNFMAWHAKEGTVRAFSVQPSCVRQAAAWNVGSDVPHSDDVALWNHPSNKNKPQLC